MEGSFATMVPRIEFEFGATVPVLYPDTNPLVTKVE